MPEIGESHKVPICRTETDLKINNSSNLLNKNYIYIKISF